MSIIVCECIYDMKFGVDGVLKNVSVQRTTLELIKRVYN